MNTLEWGGMTFDSALPPASPMRSWAATAMGSDSAPSTTTNIGRTFRTAHLLLDLSGRGDPSPRTVRGIGIVPRTLLRAAPAVNFRGNRDGMLNCGHRGLLQLHHDADDGQDRVLRSWPLWQDDEPPGHPPAHGAAVARRDGKPGDGDGPQAVLRPAPPRGRRDRRHEGPPPALHRPRPGLLQRHPQARPQGGGRRGVRGRQPEDRAGREPGIAVEPESEL